MHKSSSDARDFRAGASDAQSSLRTLTRFVDPLADPTKTALTISYSSLNLETQCAMNVDLPLPLGATTATGRSAPLSLDLRLVEVVARQQHAAGPFQDGGLAVDDGRGRLALLRGRAAAHGVGMGSLQAVREAALLRRGLHGHSLRGGGRGVRCPGSSRATAAASGASLLGDRR